MRRDAMSGSTTCLHNYRGMLQSVVLIASTQKRGQEAPEAKHGRRRPFRPVCSYVMQAVLRGRGGSEGS